MEYITAFSWGVLAMIALVAVLVTVGSILMSRWRHDFDIQYTWDETEAMEGLNEDKASLLFARGREPSLLQAELNRLRRNGELDEMVQLSSDDLELRLYCFLYGHTHGPVYRTRRKDMRFTFYSHINTTVTAVGKSLDVETKKAHLNTGLDMLLLAATSVREEK